MLFSISQGFSLPYQFLFQKWVKLHAVLRTEVTGWDMQWLFSASVTFYVLDYPYCGYWQIFILCNSWVIIPLKTYKPAFLLIKYPCSIRAWVPVSFFLSFSLSLFHFLIFDSRPPGSDPLKDSNKWRPNRDMATEHGYYYPAMYIVTLLI